MSRDAPLPLSAVLFAYVLPVLGVAAFLALSGLWGLALVVVGGEAVMSAVIVLVRQRPARPANSPSRRPWLVPLVMVVLLALMVGVAVFGARSG